MLLANVTIKIVGILEQVEAVVTLVFIVVVDTIFALLARLVYSELKLTRTLSIALRTLDWLYRRWLDRNWYFFVDDSRYLGDRKVTVTPTVNDSRRCVTFRS